MWLMSYADWSVEVQLLEEELMRVSVEQRDRENGP